MRIGIKNDEFETVAYVCQMRRPRLTFSMPYLKMNDVNTLYTMLNGGSSKGFTEFQKKAKEIAYRSPAFLFRDEQKLFELLQERFAELFQRKNITCFGQLMQMFS